MRGVRGLAGEPTGGETPPRAGWFRTRPLTAVALAALAALATLIASPSPQAGVRYPDPQVLDRPGRGDSFDPTLAVDPAGRATVVWEDELGGGRGHVPRIRSVRLGADGAPDGPAQVLSGRGAVDPALAIDHAGRATVAWVRFVGARDRPRIEFVRLGADGLPEAPVQALSEARGTDPQMGIDAAGRATIAWRRGRGEIQLLRLSADGAPQGAVRTLSDDARGAPALAVAPSGPATVVWGRARGAIEAVVIGVDGAAGPVRELEAPGGSRKVLQWQVAADRSGRATVVWRGYGESCCLYAARLGADGRPGRVRTLSEEWAKLPQLAVARAGGATVVWQGKRGAQARGRSRIRTVRLGADGEPGRTRTLSNPSPGERYPEVAVDPRGRATAVWQHDDGVSTRIQAVRLSANGKPGRVRTLSAPGRPNHANACCPQVAVDGRGRATVVWRRYDGRRFRIEATRSR